ncbi:MAG: hypothetical protein Q8O79_08045, partial [Pseudomonadota bacterium]|nr:hypothetical protein [Pseudomonadota bacterium]
MDTSVSAFDGVHHLGDVATRQIARLPGRLAALLLLAGNDPAASSRLASRPGNRTLWRVQLRNLG